MADISTYDMGGPQGSPYSPQQAVPQSSAPGIAMDLLGGALGAAGKLAEQKQAARKNMVVEEYTSRLNKYADAVDQGAMTSARARTLIRKDFDTFRANNPGLSDALLSRQKEMLSATGLGGGILEKSAEEKGFEELRKEAASNGFVNPNAPPEKQQEQIDNYQKLKLSERMAQASSAELARTTAQLNLTQSEISLANAKAKQTSQYAVSTMSAAYTPKFRDEMDLIVSRVQSGELKGEDAVAMINNSWAAVNETVRSVGAHAGNEYISSLTTSMQMIHTNALEAATGKISVDILKNKNEKALALATQDWMSIPSLAQMAAGNKLLPNSDFMQLVQNTNPAVITQMDNLIRGKANVDVFPDTPEGKADFNTTLSAVKNSLDAHMKGEMDEAGGAQVITSINTLLSSVDNMSKLATDKKSWGPLLDLLASPTYGKYAESTPHISPDNAQKVRNVIQEMYEKDLIPAIRDEYEKVNIPAVRGPTAGGVTAMPSRWDRDTTAHAAIMPVFQGSGVHFVASSQAGNNQPAIQAKVRELNSKVAPLINRQVKVSAHLEGTRDYKKVFEANYVSIFGEQLEERQAREAKAKAAPAQSQATQEPRAPRPETASSSATTSSSQPMAIPAIGETVSGYRYLGGDPNSPSSWGR